MKPDRQHDSSIAQKAAEWFFALPHADASGQAAFGAWLRESPRHVEEFLLVSAAYKELDNASAEESVDPEALRAALSASVVPIQSALPVSGFSQRSELAASPRRRWALGLAAVFIVAVLAGGWMLSAGLPGGPSYSTAVGEIRSFELPDGSVIELNTRSQVRLSFSETARDIHLLTGEALFKVARDPARPFRVHAGGVVIQAVGTAFNVYRRDQGTTVSVIEGVVRLVGQADERRSTDAGDLEAIGAPTLAAGQEARIAPDGKITAVAVADVAKATAWRQRRLVFRGERLEEVAAEFNRYNRVPQIRVEGESARAKPLAGIFDADDPESLVEFLQQLNDLSVETRAGEFVIRSREE